MIIQAKTMKKTIISMMAIFCIAIAQAASIVTFPANHNGVTYTGRIASNNDGSVSYDWTGVYLQTYFTGGYLAIDVSEADVSWHNLFIDGKWVKKLKISGKETQRIVLAEKLSKGTHLLRLQKCTEGQNGCTTIHQFVVAKGGTMKPVERKERMIEVYGDSYTCGYGTESEKATDPFSVDTENCDKAYGCIIARYFDADYALTAHSGQGMVRNWASPTQVAEVNMSTRYTQIFDDHGTQAYNFDLYKPQLVLINIGTNDFSPGHIPTDEQYVGAYVKMVETIQQKYPGVKVLCVTPHSANRYLQACLDLLKERTANMKDVFMANPLSNMVTVEHDMGADYHPNYQGQRKIAMSLIPQISAIMEWPMNAAIVE